MKNKKIIFSLTAATLLLSLCGFFVSNLEREAAPVFSGGIKYVNEESFSADKAQKLIDLCSAAHYPESLEALMKEEGFEDFCYKEQAQESIFGSGIAFGCAHLGASPQSTEVTVVFRSTDGFEWYSNFSVGEGITHAGFLAAADFSKEAIDTYLRENNISKASARITLTGHSRGGGVANLVAKAYIDEGEFASLSAYTFASPNTTTDKNASSQKYSSIYNLQNPEDFICYIPLECWGYTKYGVSLSFPKGREGEYKTLYKKMQESFFNKCDFPHKGYQEGFKDIEELLLTFSKLCPTVRDYYQKRVHSSVSDVTLYEYMDRVSCVLSGENPAASGLFILSCLENSDLSSITNLLLQGISLKDITKSRVLTQGALYCSHICEVYEAWLEVLPEDYFSPYLK